MKSTLIGLFSRRKEKQGKNELEVKIKTVLKNFKHDDLLQFCFDVIGNEPEWNLKWCGMVEGGYYPNYEPPKQKEFEEFVWDHIIKNKISYKALQDFAVKYNLVPRNYFPEREDLISNNETFGFSESVKSIILKRQDGKCERCTRYSPPYLFDHKDGNLSNTSQKNCQALCTTCYKRKILGHY